MTAGLTPTSAAPEPAPARPLIGRANSSAFFKGQLKNILGAPSQVGEKLVVEDGRTIRITATKYSIPPSDSVAVPLATYGDKGLLATLIQTGKASELLEPGAANYVSDLAIFEFIGTMDQLMVPYIKSHAYHRALDSVTDPRVVEIGFSMPQMLDLQDLRRHEDLWRFEEKWGIEVILQTNDAFRRHKRLAVFDMDSTLIQQEVVDEIARFVGKEAEVSAITARAMNGEIDFSESLRQRVALLKGVPATVFEELKSVITFTPGARELCKALKMLGYKMAVLSGGFIPLANYVKEELGLDYAYANQLVVSADGKELTGELTGEIVHAERKELLLQQIAAENGVPLQQTIAIGDGANDLKMMHRAGLGVAFNAKAIVQAEAPCRMNSNTLKDVLYLLGLTREEQAQLC